MQEVEVAVEAVAVAEAAARVVPARLCLGGREDGPSIRAHECGLDADAADDRAVGLWVRVAREQQPRREEAAAAAALTLAAALPAVGVAVPEVVVHLQRELAALARAERDGSEGRARCPERVDEE